MELLGVGPLEFLFIILIALIVLGPNDMIKAGRTIGKFLRNLFMSQGWRTIRETSRDLKYLPNKLMREAGLEEPLKEISEDLNKDIQEIDQDLKKIDQEIKTSLPDKSELTVDLTAATVQTGKPKTSVYKEDPTDWTTPPVIIESPPPPAPAEPQAAKPENTVTPENK